MEGFCRKSSEAFIQQDFPNRSILAEDQTIDDLYLSLLYCDTIHCI